MSKSFFFNFCQILFNLTRMFATHHEKSFVPLLITYLITLSLEKKTGKSLEFWIQLKSVPTLGIHLPAVQVYELHNVVNFFSLQTQIFPFLFNRKI